MKKKIVHIYYNTEGNSGLYLNPIYEALESTYCQEFLVNYYYPLELEAFKKMFFKVTEKTEQNKNSWVLKKKLIRKLMRYIELKIANRRIIKYIKNASPEIINYSLTNMPGAYEFLVKIKQILPNVKLVVTCHDVIGYESTKTIQYSKIYSIADYLLIHAENARDILKDKFNVNDSKIIYHPFPSINLALLLNSENQSKPIEIKKPRFLFIGVMRQEKGVQNLIDAWEVLGEDFDAELMIAGYKPNDVEIDFSKISHFHNFNCKIAKLSDQEYINAIINTDYIIFPYTQVGNSGVLSSAVSLGGIPITTKLPTFQESEYVLSKYMCEQNTKEELVKLLKEVKNNLYTSIDLDKQYICKVRDENEENFKSKVRVAYEKIA